MIGGEKIYIKYIIICLYYYKLSAAKTSRAADDEEESRGKKHDVDGCGDGMRLLL